MKRLIAVVFFLGVAVSIALADGIIGKDLNGNAVQGFAPSAFRVYSSTKANMTHNTTNNLAVRFTPSADVTVYINGTGAGYPVAAGFPETYVIRKGGGVSSLVFAHSSSATKTKIYLQEQ